LPTAVRGALGSISRVNATPKRLSWTQATLPSISGTLRSSTLTRAPRITAMSLAMGFMADTMFAVGRLAYAGTFERFSGIRWIFTHLGGTIPFVLPRYDNYYRQFPENREHIDRPPSEMIREQYYDTCTMHAPALRCALDTLGPEQLVFGSDYPHVPGGIDRFVDILNSVGMSAEELEMVGRRNALDLIGVEDTTTVGEER